MGNNPSNFKDNGANRPVETVSWNDAVEFCKRLSQKTGRTYRLPSEAEWEYACRAGTSTPFHFGETITADLANYHSEVAYASAPTKKARGQTTPVGSFSANAFGLYDMHGNVWEWCQDIWYDNYKGAPVDGSPWLTGLNTNNTNTTRLLRGGSWDFNPVDCRSANLFIPDDRYYFIGFRVVVVPA
jgi:formylglycine-generating enzyme required for sulfatase activity